MKLSEAISICEKLVATEDGSQRGQALRVVLDVLAQATGYDHEEHKSYDFETEFILAGEPLTEVVEMVQRREQAGWTNHATAYTFKRPAFSN